MSEPVVHARSIDHDRSALAEWRRIGELVALAVEQAIVPIEGVHRAVATSWFRLGGRRAAPARRTYSALTDATYGAIRSTSRGAVRVAGAAASIVALRRPLPPPGRSGVASRAEAVLNSLWGDDLDGRNGVGSFPTIRDLDGLAVAPEPDDLRRGHPAATGRVVVLLHGLCETERTWRSRTVDDHVVPGLGDVLESAGYTPLRIRYNTGRSIADNGADLSELVQQVVDWWPVPVDEVSFVGYSMGGLVGMSALLDGAARDRPWSVRARHLVTLGAPHRGSHIEQGAELVAQGLHLIPVTSPIGSFIDSRSVGIKDLRRGTIGDDGCSAIGVRHHFLGATITADTAHPVGRLVGDLVVRSASSTARDAPGMCVNADTATTETLVIGRHHHLALTGDPAIHEQVIRWLTC